MKKISGREFRTIWLLAVLSTALLCLAACESAAVSNAETAAPSSLSTTPPVERNIVDSYREKLQEYVDEFGAPQEHREGESGSIAGLAYAQLIDFGAGDYLVVCHRASVPTKNADSFSSANAYIIEVWAPDESGLDATLAYSSEAGSAIAYAKLDGKTYLAGVSNETEISHGPNDDVQSYLLVGIGEDESFGIVEDYVRIVSAERDPQTNARLADTFAINGKPATSDEWMAAMDERNRDFVSYPVAASGNDLPLLGDTLETTMATLESLSVSFEPYGREDKSVESDGNPKSGEPSDAASQLSIAPLKEAYEANEEVTIPGTLRVTSQGPVFAGKGLWAYVELPRPIFIEGGAYYTTQVQDVLQVGLDFYFESDSPRNLSLPYWEPYDGEEVLVKGTITEVAGMSVNQMGAFKLKDAEIVEVLPEGTIESLEHR